MTELQRYFENHNNRYTLKWQHYLEVYDRHFSKYKGKDVVILEIGVYEGGSLQMWKHYFGGKARIYGVDLNPKCAEVQEENIQIFIGSQSDRAFLRKLKAELPKVDILIDDGGHHMRHQITTYEELFDMVKDDGVYLCEDLHTSYNSRFGGGYHRRGTFIEYSKNFIDYLHGWYSTQPRSLGVSAFTSSVFSVTYYTSVVVIEKRKVSKPVEIKCGTMKLITPRSAMKRTRWHRVKYYFVFKLEILLQALRMRSPRF